MKRPTTWRPSLVSALALSLALTVACGSASTPAPTNTPGAPGATRATAPTQPSATATAAPTAPAATTAPARPTATLVPTAAPTVTPQATGVVSARDQMTLVIPSEPTTANPFLNVGGGLTTALIKDNLAEPFTWHSGDNLRVVPTTATESWEQLGLGKWRFELRKGVKFHNGEAWNAEAAMPSLEFQGQVGNANSSSQNTGAFKAAVVGEYTVEITCDPSCPVFPKTAIFLNFEAPNFYTTASEEEVARTTVSFGPYKQVKWDPGISFTQEAYADYTQAGDHFEFQKALVKNLTWYWRGETNVLIAMVNTGEADMAWDVGVDATKALRPEQLKAGGSAEVASFWLDTLWHPELKKTKVRQAIAHAINCQELVEALYAGLVPCRGNIIFPGVLGATERNTAPYEFDQDLARRLLEEADYNPENVIRITGRPARIPKQLEYYEAIQGYMTEVGMNVEINVIEPATWSILANCRIGKAVNEVLQAQGKDPEKDKPTLADMQAAIDKGAASCPTAEMQETGGYSVESLDFSKVLVDALNCLRLRSAVCDPSPGGIQEQMDAALASTGEERRIKMEAFADRIHDEVLWLGVMELPTIYAVNPKLNWNPRFDHRVRVNTMWFSP